MLDDSRFGGAKAISYHSCNKTRKRSSAFIFLLLTEERMKKIYLAHRFWRMLMFWKVAVSDTTVFHIPIIGFIANKQYYVANIALEPHSHNTPLCLWKTGEHTGSSGRLEGKNRDWRRRFGWKDSYGKAWGGSPRSHWLIILSRCYVAWNAKIFKNYEGKKKTQRGGMTFLTIR